MERGFLYHFKAESGASASGNRNGPGSKSKKNSSSNQQDRNPECCVTVFSAARYCGVNDNAGATLLIREVENTTVEDGRNESEVTLELRSQVLDPSLVPVAGMGGMY